MWQKLKEQTGIKLVSTWIYQSGDGQTADWSSLWGSCIYEASTADYLIAYFEDGETHSGAFVEIGCALAQGKQVFAVNMPPSYKIGRYAHIRHFPDMEKALAEVQLDWLARRDPSLDGKSAFTLYVAINTEDLPPPPVTHRLINFAERSLKEELIATGLNYKLAEVNMRRADLGTEYADLQNNLVKVADGG